jgi:hypothetical protein
MYTTNGGGGKKGGECKGGEGRIRTSIQRKGGEKGGEGNPVFAILESSSKLLLRQELGRSLG